MVALVNQQPILRSDFVTQLESETSLPFDQTTEEDRLRVLDEMLREELFVQRGLELNFAETDQDTRTALYTIVEQQVTAGVMTAKVKEADLHKYFEAHRGEFMADGKLDVHDLVASDEHKAAEAAQALRGGMSLDDAKRRFGLEAGEYEGDEAYPFAKAHLGEEVFDVVVKLETGAVSDPIQQDDGYHVVQVVKHTKPTPQSFEQARSQVEFAYTNAEKARLLHNMFKFLRGRSTILITDEYKNVYNPDAFADNY
jgi:parvulin-like peptidyl-prolyl isomerase